MEVSKIFILLAFVALAAGASIEKDAPKSLRCSLGYSECYYGGDCIPNYRICDDSEDCYYGEDEYNCEIPANTTTCNTPFDLVGDKCILVDIFESVTWAEGRYLCEKFSADLVTIESMEFFGELLDYLNVKELTGHNYWVGANDTTVEGEWMWLNGEPVRTGTPLWALYKSSSYYEQEPISSTADCASLDMDRFHYMVADDCTDIKGAICQLIPGTKTQDLELVDLVKPRSLKEDEMDGLEE